MLPLKNWSLRLLSILKRTAANITEDMKGSKPISLSTLKWSRLSNDKHVLAFVFLYFCRIIYSSQVFVFVKQYCKANQRFSVITRKFRMLVINGCHLPCFFTPTSFSRSSLLSQSLYYRLVNNLLKRQSYRHSSRFSKKYGNCLRFPQSFRSSSISVSRGTLIH